MKGTPIYPTREATTATVVTKVRLNDFKRQSLDRLVTFLTRFFHYLANCKVGRHLLLTDTGILVIG
jgi:hypothetical protein